ncbi:coniferyl-aldehyde dehydrogenase [Gammaproteobacteria bacterium 45_16_T64]|nr:coniferyl-aldehyde dehydrogenase [Gammaproteobacteria bacterium 45_16_T64]
MVANVAHMADHSTEAQEMQRIFNAQKTAFRANPMPTAEERIEHLKRLKPTIIKHMEALETAISEDFSNRSRSETKVAEVMPSLEGIKYHIKNLKKWMRDDKRHVPTAFKPAKAKVVYQPLGVVGIIVPWNYPFFLALGPLLPALAAGNRVMIKMSEFTPRTSELFKQMMAEIFPEDHVCVITGEADVAMAFTKLPFDHILFTGSTAVGKHVMRAAAENLTPVTLELGGKSPAIISDSFPMKDAAERMSFGKAMNVGQTCVAPDYVLLPKHRIDEFVDEMRNVISTWYPTMRDNDDYTAIVNERQHQRLQGYLDEAQEKGATIIPLNASNDSFEGTRKMPITLVLNSNEDMKIEQEEIFGPLLIVKPYDSLDEAINYVNDRPRPLALYYFDYNSSRSDYVLRHTHSGGACINDTLSHVAVDDIPFGGIGPAGMGAYHGKEGFLTFSKAKGVYTKGKINGAKAIYPPWDRPIHKILFGALLK